ncbi:MAG: DNA polymerase/3'-5' exonuclease PolX [Candidatus Spechtbacteria bacterium]|nr:DNA polymerase/3'-5' exonuclease PolX [Candidatus Spechtbacteria bacterium]
MTNAQIAQIFKNIAVYLEMQDVPFKPRAYEKVAQVLESLDQEVSDVYKKGGREALENIPGVGASIAEHIEELIKTGKLKYYEQLKKKMPVKFEELRSVEGLGPKTIKLLYKKLGIKTLKDLEKAAKAGKIHGITGLGKKTEENILRGIEFVKKSSGRLLLGEALPQARKIVEDLKEIKEVEAAFECGSLRRRQETVGDLDFIVFSTKPAEVIKKFLKFPVVKHVYSQGQHKALVRLDSDIDADISVMSSESLGSALIAWTGSKQHNISIRTLAEKKGWLLNDYGLWKGKVLLASKTEEDVYKKLGMDFIPPEIRNASGEVEVALKGRLPKLIKYNDLKGDLQIQTNWTDGNNSIDEMAEAAKKFGHEYIAITDHTKSLAMTGGSDEKKLREQMKAIEDLNKKISGITILTGAEVNIMKDGSLDIADEVLAELDVVGISAHSFFHMSKKEMTERILRAMNNPNVDILFHPTGRIIGQRPEYEVDVERIIEEAKNTGTVLEINGYPERLDLKDEYIRMAVEKNVKMAIDSDAHNVAHLPYVEYGIAQARRGWAEASDIINTRPMKEMLAMLKDGHK